jgi:hypothetical protein
MPSLKALNQEIARMQRLIKGTPFNRCLEITSSFRNLTFQGGVYAIKSSEEEILYIGKTGSFRTRFQGGHQGLVRIFLAGYRAEDIRILPISTTDRFAEDLLKLERSLIVNIVPRYNKRIPDILEVVKMIQLQAVPASGNIQQLLQFLPEQIQQQLEAHADHYGVPEQKLFERAVAFFLDPDGTTFADVEPDVRGIGVVSEENEILKAENESLKAKLRILGAEDL